MVYCFMLNFWAVVFQRASAAKDNETHILNRRTIVFHWCITLIVTIMFALLVHFYPTPLCSGKASVLSSTTISTPDPAYKQQCHLYTAGWAFYGIQLIGTFAMSLLALVNNWMAKWAPNEDDMRARQAKMEERKEWTRTLVAHEPVAHVRASANVPSTTMTSLAPSLAPSIAPASTRSASSVPHLQRSGTSSGTSSGSVVPPKRVAVAKHAIPTSWAAKTDAANRKQFKLHPPPEADAITPLPAPQLASRYTPTHANPRALSTQPTISSHPSRITAAPARLGPTRYARPSGQYSANRI
ncbi:hypothetical protein BKA62DRAFT_683478 [Auriculariales sp. MPI-PUGE-AT-0066]|nr:hypothetical protein BKA62DRAFT_683478 [Auriculariales sp. MPI-PUGE-AT-0066]